MMMIIWLIPCFELKKSKNYFWWRQYLGRRFKISYHILYFCFEKAGKIFRHLHLSDNINLYHHIPKERRSVVDR